MLSLKYLGVYSILLFYTSSFFITLYCFRIFCHDEAVCRKYIKDPWCSFIFTNSGFGELLQLVDRCNRPDWYAAIPKELPVWLYAGDEDAVGGCGKGVTEVYEGLKAQGLKDVTITLYHGARHEVHNESMKEELFRDIIDYLVNHMPKAE